MTNHKQYIYTKGNDPVLDAEFEEAKAFGKVKPGKSAIFWRYGLRKYALPVDGVQRIYRRVEQVFGKLCCGGRNFVIEWLVLVLQDGSEVVIHIGYDVKKQAEELLEHLKMLHPEIQYGKV